MDECENYNYNSSSLGKVILKINQMCKKPTIEAGLCEQLDLFVEKLHESDKYLENGIFNVNFTEAALFVQSATELYSKKVDLLWDNILEYQKRMILYETKRDGQEIDKLEERINRFKRKKTKILTNQQMVDPVQSLFKESDLHEIDIERIDTVYQNWGIPREENQHRTGESDVFDIKQDTSHIDNLAIYDDEHDVLYDEPNITMKRWHGMNILRMIYNLYDKGLVNDMPKIITKIRTDVDLEYRFRLENDISPEVSTEKIDHELRDWVQSFILAKRANISHELECIRKKVCPVETIINLQRLPSLLVNKKLRRKSIMDYPPDITSSENSCNMIEDLVPEKSKPSEEMLPLLTMRLENLADKDTTDRKLSQDSGFCDMSSDELMAEDFEQENGPHELEPQCTLNVTQQNDDILKDLENLREIEKQGEKESVQEPENEPQVEKSNEEEGLEEEEINQIDVTIKEVVKSCQTERKKREKILVKSVKINEQEDNKRKIKEDNVLDTPLKRRKLSKKQIAKFSIPIKESKMSTFEKFYSLNYTAETNEGTVEEYESESDNEDTEVFLGFPHEEIEQYLQEKVYEKETSKDIEALQDSADNDANEVEHDEVPNINDDFEASQEDTEPAEVPELSVEPSTSKTKKKDPNMGPTNEDIAESRENVKKWKLSIMPQLKALKNAEFDIHKYGSQIMEPLEINEVKMFKDIVKEKSSAEVVRYFISSLQLANTYNIEIGGAQKAKLSNDTFKIKLLTKERYHEHLNDYEAPSEENFRERIQKIHKLQDVKENSSKTKQPPSKRQKVSN
ncbi:unnamed protein product [Brassicogethes aeneus]|uniref:Condensin-2 complex subunit H2 C-terminal domain-containing protein n=1 Tax=Brassicogethes aeneus TaxID=1431903 RepID=A0A9P0FEA9_BRAAE|nr:unnamed protein product [Brassicogethes aeneus]